ncbi:MAG: hypothetical protein ACOVKV_11095, partial [Novosphingobium sp.]
MTNAPRWIADNASAWRSRNAQAQDLTAALPSLQSEAAGATAVLTGCRERADDSTNKLAVAEADLAALANERGLLLDGQSVVDAERAVEDRQQRAAATQCQAAERRELTARERTAIAARLDSARDAVCQAQADRDMRAKVFATSLTQSDLTVDDVARVASGGAVALEIEAKALADLDKAAAIAQAMLTQREQDLVAHNASEAPALLGESLQHALQAAAEACRQAAERCSEADLVLRRDNEVRSQTAQLRAELEKRGSEADVWLRLNDLIGD